MNINLKKGCYQYPDDWVLVQNMDPMAADYCLALSVKSGEDLGLPTFLFLMQENVALTPDFIHDLYSMIAEDFPKFKTAMKFDSAFDQLDFGNTLSCREEILKSHPIGIFDPMILCPNLVSFEALKSEQ